MFPFSVFSLFLVLFSGDLPYEAHVQTHSGGASGYPPLSPENRISQYPHTRLSHLSFALLFFSLPPHLILCARLLFCLEKKKREREKRQRKGIDSTGPQKDTVSAILFALFSRLVKISVAVRLAAISTQGVCC